MSEEDVSINYILTGSGWSACTVEIYGQKCVATASYLSDALRELVSGTNHILSGGNEARFRFDEEPGEYRWILRSDQGGGVSVQILEFAELWGEKPDSEGKPILQATCVARHLGEALLVTLNRLLEEHGLDGYEKAWVEAEFPTEEYLKLCARLGAEPSSNVLKRRRAQRARS